MIISPWILLGMRNVSDKIGERKHVSHFKKFFFSPENRTFYVVTDNIVIGRWEDAISCRIVKARIHTRTGNIKYLLLFRSNSGYANAPQCYVLRTLLFLFQIRFWHINSEECLLHLFAMSHDVVRGCQATSQRIIILADRCDDVISHSYVSLIMLTPREVIWDV
jgi:hypothetical protein